jgi:putative colanic acid biosynthesis UDP-glucose lipid carrier transferase
MDGLELVAGKTPAEAARDFPSEQAAVAGATRTPGITGVRESKSSCTQVQGALYAAVVCGTLPLVLMMHQVPFSLPYQVLGLLTGLLAYFSLQNLPLTGSWDIRLRGGNGTTLLLTWAKMIAGVCLIGFATGYRNYFSLHVLLIWSVAAPMALLLVGSQLRRAVASVHASGKSRRAVLVFANASARRFAERLQSAHTHELLGYFEDRDPARVGDVLGAMPRLGNTGDLASYVSRHGIDVVFISLPAKDSERAVSVARSLGDTTASVYFVPEFQVGAVETRAIEVASMPLLEVMETPFYGADGVLKRVFDVGFSLCALTALALPMLCIAAAVRLSSRGPALFLQKRYGLNGREFHVFKFRTMYCADRSKDIVQVSRQDSRVTPLGRFLRRTSLDELPQFLNVLIGDMSVVGPRPHTVAHNEYYRSQVQGYMSRHKVKPGITGLAQVSGCRGETATVDAMDARIRHDIDYIRNWSVITDLEIVLKTAFVFLRDKNAY